MRGAEETNYDSTDGSAKLIRDVAHPHTAAGRSRQHGANELPGLLNAAHLIPRLASDGHVNVAPVTVLPSGNRLCLCAPLPHRHPEATASASADVRQDVEFTTSLCLLQQLGCLMRKHMEPRPHTITPLKLIRRHHHDFSIELPSCPFKPRPFKPS